MTPEGPAGDSPSRRAAAQPPAGNSNRRATPERRTQLNWKLRLAIPVAVLLLRTLSRTWRLVRVNPDALDDSRRAGRSVVFAFWHCHMLPLIHAHRDQNITVLVSEHKDGEIIARIAGAFGFPSIRGSTSRGAVRSLLSLVRLAGAGADVGVTPDGPRGPARSFAPGVILAAQRAAVPLVMIAAHASRSWRLNTWDGFIVPKPFATIYVAYGEPRVIQADAKPEESAMEFQILLNETCARAGER